MTNGMADENDERKMFRYRILRYVPNLIRDEWVNIGVLLEDDKRLTARDQVDRGRLRVRARAAAESRYGRFVVAGACRDLRRELRRPNEAVARLP